MWAKLRTNYSHGSTATILTSNIIVTPQSQDILINVCAITRLSLTVLLSRGRFHDDKKTLRPKMVNKALKKEAVRYFTSTRDPASFSSASKLRKHYFKKTAL